MVHAVSGASARAARWKKSLAGREYRKHQD
jgi:hypothetical protein